MEQYLYAHLPEYLAIGFFLSLVSIYIGHRLGEDYSLCDILHSVLFVSVLWAILVPLVVLVYFIFDLIKSTSGWCKAWSRPYAAWCGFWNKPRIPGKTGTMRRANKAVLE